MDLHIAAKFKYAPAIFEIVVILRDAPIFFRDSKYFFRFLGKRKHVLDFFLCWTLNLADGLKIPILGGWTHNLGPQMLNLASNIGPEKSGIQK